MGRKEIIHFFFGLTVHATKSKFGIAARKKPHRPGPDYVDRPHW